MAEYSLFVEHATYNFFKSRESNRKKTNFKDC